MMMPVDMIEYIGTGETATPISSFIPNQFNYSFTVKYVGLLRQVFNPLSMRSKIYCNGYTGLRDFAVA